MERNKHYFFNVASGFSHCASSCKMKKKTTEKNALLQFNKTWQFFGSFYFGHVYIFMYYVCKCARAHLCLRSFACYSLMSVFIFCPFLPFVLISHRRCRCCCCCYYLIFVGCSVKLYLEHSCLFLPEMFLISNIKSKCSFFFMLQKLYLQIDECVCVASYFFFFFFR